MSNQSAVWTASVSVLVQSAFSSRVHSGDLNSLVNSRRGSGWLRRLSAVVPLLLLLGSACLPAQTGALQPITAGVVYGQGGSFTSGTANNGGVTANSLSNPLGIAFDANGNAYVADRSNNRVLFYPAGSTTATRVYGQNGSFTITIANNGGITANSLNQPFAVTTDSSGNLYVADYGNNRVLFYPNGSTTATRVYGQNGSFRDRKSVV